MAAVYGSLARHSGVQSWEGNTLAVTMVRAVQQCAAFKEDE